MLLMLAQAAAAVAEPQLPTWMTGCWEQRSGENWTEECWTAPRGGMMIGSSRSGRGDRLTEWETMQVILRSTPDATVPPMAFWASPGGQSRTMFGWSPVAGQGVTFTNPQHDYPQRIRYWREGEELLAEISRMDGSNARRWRMKPLR